MSIADAPIKGVYAALPTFYTERTQIDQKAVDHIVEYLLSQEIKGLALLTEAAEDVLLSADERRTIIKSVAAQAKGKKSLIVGVSDIVTREALELVRFAESKGAEAMLLSMLRVPGLGYRELYRHIDRIGRTTQMPIILNVRPGGALDSLTPEEITALLAHPRLSGLFVPGNPPNEVGTWRKRLKRDMSVLTGSSLSFSKAAEQTASGVICGMSVVATERAVEIWKAIEDGDNSVVGKLEAKFRPIVEMMGPPPSGGAQDGIQRLATKLAKRSLTGPALLPTFRPGLIKEALRLQGHPVRGDVRPPFENVKPDVSERLKSVLKIGGLV